MYDRMPMHDLKNVYMAAVRCLDCYYGISQELLDSGLREYINSWVDVMRVVIAERVCKDCGILPEGRSE